MRSNAQYIALILIPLLLGLTACVAKKTAATSTGTDKPEVVQSQDMEKMAPEFLYLAAQNALSDGNVDLATQLLDIVVRKDPAAIAPHIQLIELLLMRRQIDKAAKHTSRLLENRALSPKQFERLQLLQVRLQAIRGQTEAALGSLDILLQQQPENSKAHNLKIQILSGQNRIEEALEALEAAINIKDRMPLRLLQAQLYLKQGQRDAARASLQRVLQLTPDNGTAVLMLSNMAKSDRDFKQAEKLLRDFLIKYPESLSVGDALGRLLAQQNRLSEAIPLYQEMAATSADPNIRRTLGLLHYQNGDFKRSEEVFRKLFAKHPDDSVKYYLAINLEALNKLSEARRLFEEIAINSPLSVEARIRLAGLNFRDNKLDETVRLLKEILQQNPTHADAYLLLSSVRIVQKQYQPLLDETEPALTLDNIPLQLLFNRAVAFDHFKNYQQLEAMLNRVLKHDSDHAEALNFLGYTYAERGIHLDQAELMIQQALKQKPGDGYFLDSLAWAYFKKGEYDKAIQTQEKALIKVENDAVMYEHFGDMLWKNNNRQSAREAWEKAIELKSEFPERLKEKIAKGLKTER